MRRNHGAISRRMMFNLIESRGRVFRNDQRASYRELPDPAPALSIPCRHCVGERDLRRLNCWRHA
jgi:hypothetical protein